MAQKIVLLDDREKRDHGTEVIAEHSIAFTYDGVTYHLDLTGANRKRFEGDIAPWVNAASRTEGRPRPGGGYGRKPSAYYEGLRAYCAEHGRPLTPNPDGKYVYPEKLRAEYDAVLAAKEGGS
jgi:hypothetical protein